MASGFQKDALNKSNTVPSVGKFFEEWIVQHEHLLEELISTQGSQCSEEDGSRDDYFKDLVNRVLAHYQQYYDAKSRVAEEDVFFLFSPSWLTSLEQTFLWVAGFKPGMLFKIIEDTVLDLSDDQKRSLDTLRHQTRTKERKLSNKLAKLQEKVAGSPFFQMARRYGRRPVDGEINQEEAVTEGFKSEIESLVRKADTLRTETTLGVVKMMKSAQNLKCFTAATQLQMSIRNKGLQIDAARGEAEE